MDNETQIDDILSHLKKDGKKKKKRINGSQKGKRGEREVCALLSAHFDLPFVKDPDNFGSGAWSTTHDEQLQAGLDMDSIAGDIITPKGFRFSIENKKGYDLEILTFFPGSNKKSDLKKFQEFISQCQRDADRVKKTPMLLYKKDRCPIISFVPKAEDHWLPDKMVRFYIEGFVGVSLLDLLQLPKDFFFNAKK